MTFEITNEAPQGTFAIGGLVFETDEPATPVVAVAGALIETHEVAENQTVSVGGLLFEV